MEYRMKSIIYLIFLVSCTSSSLNFDETVSINIESCNILYNEFLTDNRDSKEEIFIVGHAYGRPGEGSFFPDRLTLFFQQNLNPNTKNYLALTGDFVRNPDLESYIKVKNYINDNFNGYFISIGNHEIGNGNNTNGPGLDNYFEVFGDDFFYEEFNHFLLISGNFSNKDWLPNEKQKKEINDLINLTDKDYVIILSHQLFWLLDSKGDISPNSDAILEEDLKKDSLNWILNSDDKNFIIISGDFGAFGDKAHCTYEDNKLFIANGIGDYESDTILKISENETSFNIKEFKLNNF